MARANVTCRVPANKLHSHFAGGSQSLETLKLPIKPNAWSIAEVLKPHSRALAFGLLGAIGETLTNLLEPWPLKIVLDNVLKTRTIHGWLNPLIESMVGTAP